MALFANESRFFRFRVIFQACSLLNEVGDPPFSYISDISNSSTLSGKSLRKKSMLENFRANVLKEVIGSLSKPRRRRRRDRHQTNDLMSRTIAVLVRYKSLYISLPSSAKQEREMTKFCRVYETWTTTANFRISIWN